MVWLDGWQNRSKITISKTPGAGTNYVLPLRVGESPSASNYDLVAGHCHTFPPAKNDSGDLRFALDDGTVCNMWVGHVVGSAPNRTAYVWVQIPVSLDDEDVTLYCYMGNPNAGNVSSPDGLFLFFDDFDGSSLDPNKWRPSGAVVLGNSTVKINADHRSDTSDDTIISVPEWDVTEDALEITAYVVAAVSPRICVGYTDVYYRWDNGGSSWWGFYVNGVRVSNCGQTFSAPKITATRIVPDVGLRCDLDGNRVCEYIYGQTPSAGLLPVYVATWYTSDTTIDWLFVRRLAPTDPRVIFSPFAQAVGTNVIYQPSLPAQFGETRSLWTPAYAPLTRRGAGVIQGTVQVAGQPARRRVTLLDRRTMTPLAMTWSDPITGEYVFAGYSPHYDYLVVCGDYTRTYNAAVADWVQVEVT